MTINTKIAAAVTVLTLAASAVVPSSSAQARGLGLAAGLIGGALVGAAIVNSANAAPVYYDGYRRCHLVPQYNSYGYYIGRVRVCD